MLLSTSVVARMSLLGALVFAPLVRAQFPPDVPAAGSQPTLTPFTPPAPRPDDDLSEHAQVQQLANGMRILVVSDHRYPLLSVQMWFNVGSAADADTPGTCDLARAVLEHREDAALRLRAAGIDFDSRTLADATVFASTIPADPRMLDLVLDLETQRFAPQRVTKDAVAAAAEAVRLARHMDQLASARASGSNSTILREQNSDSRDEALALAPPLGNALFAGHSYAAVRQPLDREPIAPVQIDDFLKTWFVPANATLMIIGDIDLDTAFTHAEPRFTPLPRRDRPRRPAEDLPQGRRCDLTSGGDPASVRSLQFCWQTPYYADFTNVAIEVLMHRLCNPVDGPLFARLRAAGVGPPRWNLERWRDAGVLLLEVELALLHPAGVASASAAAANPTERVAAIRAAVTEELRRCADARPGEVELIRARRLAERDALRLRRDFQTYAALLGRCEIVGGDVLLADFDRPRTQRVAVGSLQDAATYLLESNAGVCARVFPTVEPGAPNCEYLDSSELLAALRSYAPPAPFTPSMPTLPPAREWRSDAGIRVRAVQASSPGALVFFDAPVTRHPRAEALLDDPHRRDFASFRGFDLRPRTTPEGAADAAWWIADSAELDTLLEFAARPNGRPTTRPKADSQPTESTTEMELVQIVSSLPLETVRQCIVDGLGVELKDRDASARAAQPPGPTAPRNERVSQFFVEPAAPAVAVEIEITLTLRDDSVRPTPPVERIIGRLFGVPDSGGSLIDARRAARWRYRIPSPGRVTLVARTAAPASTSETELEKLYLQLRDRLQTLQTTGAPRDEFEYAWRLARIDEFAAFAGPWNLATSLAIDDAGGKSSTQPAAPPASTIITQALRDVRPTVLQRGGAAGPLRRSGLADN